MEADAAMKNAVVVAAAFVGAVALAVLAWAVIGPSGDEGRRPAALTSSRPAVAMSWRGEWSQDEKYGEGEVVTFQQSAYVAERESGGTSPDPDCSKDCDWSLLTLQGPQGPEGPRGSAGPQGPAGAQGPPGNPLANLDALEGLACNIGRPAEGIAHIIYDDAMATLRCQPTNLVQLRVDAKGGQLQSMTISVSGGGIPPGACYGPTENPPQYHSCRWWVARDATMAFTGSPGFWGGACSGTGFSCSVVMSGDRVVSRERT